MNKLTKRIIEIVLGLALLLLFSASALAQDQPPPPEAGQISAPLRSAAYPEATTPTSFDTTNLIKGSSTAFCRKARYKRRSAPRGPGLCPGGATFAAAKRKFPCI